MIPTNYFKVWVPASDGHKEQHFLFPFATPHFGIGQGQADAVERNALSCADTMGGRLSVYRDYKRYRVIGVNNE
jgi:hypothetical protein